MSAVAEKERTALLPTSRVFHGGLVPEKSLTGEDRLFSRADHKLVGTAVGQIMFG